MTPLWGRANSPGLPFTAVNHFTANASVGGDQNQQNDRIDHTISDKEGLFAC